MWRTDSLEKTLNLEILKARGERDDRGWDGWMASLTQWTWVWVSSMCWWWTGNPGMLHSIGWKETWLNKWTELIMTCRKHWANEGGPPWACVTLEIPEEAQQTLRHLGMRQTISTPVFEDSDLATFTAGIEVKILESTPQYLVWDAGIQAKSSWGRRHIWCWAIHCWSGENWQNPGTGPCCRQDPRQGELKKPKGYPKHLWRTG